MVGSHFQDNLSPGSRGFNIGSVLVNPSSYVVFHGLNSIISQKSFAHHGEVRCMMGYLNTASLDTYSLEGYTLYTSLEPCAMCAGMMVMTGLSRTVFVQSELDFKSPKSDCKLNYGKTLERLASSVGQFTPYPQSTNNQKSKHAIADEFDCAYASFQANVLHGKHSMEKFLITSQAHDIFRKGISLFLNYEILHQQNRPFYRYAVEYYKQNTQR